MIQKSIYTKEYHENFALNALKKYYPDKFSDFKKQECPDWVCGKIGLEITRAVSTQDGELDAFIKDCQGKEFFEIKKARLKKLGFDTELTKGDQENIYEVRSLKNGVIGFYHATEDRYIFLYFLSRMEPVDNCTNSIINAVKRKLEKLNNNYDLLEENNLAIIVQEQLDYVGLGNIIIDEVVESIIDKIKSLYSNGNTTYANVFENIYIIFCDNMFAICTKDFSYKRTRIPRNAFLSLSQESMGKG